MNFTQLQGHLRTRCAQNQAIYLYLVHPRVQSLSVALGFSSVPLLPHPFSTPPSSFLLPSVSAQPCLSPSLAEGHRWVTRLPSALLVSVLGRMFPPGKHSPSLHSPPSCLPLCPPFSFPLTPALSVSPFCYFLIPCYTPALPTPMELLAMAARF